jgi:3-oxoacyl-[acyl-carrier protein] reductase
MDTSYTDYPKLPDQLKVIVTGGMSGIGRSQVQQFLEKGHRVLAVDLKEDADLVNKWTANYPRTFSFRRADCSDLMAVTALFQEVKDTWGKIDVLCNTAGILDDYKPLDQTDPASWQAVINNNLQVVYNMTYTALPLLLANPTSRLINMASIAGLTAGGGGIAYTTAKHAIVGFTKQMAYDYADKGLVANAIAPGAIMTPMNQADFVGTSPMADQVMAQTPAKRWASPDEVAALTLFLASDQAAYMQGNIIPVDGDWMIR